MYRRFFFQDSDIYWYYNKYVISRQLKGQNILTCCLDSGYGIDSYSLSLLHSYYEQKFLPQGQVCIGSSRIVSISDLATFDKVNFQGRFREAFPNSIFENLRFYIETCMTSTTERDFRFDQKTINKITFNMLTAINWGALYSKLDAILVTGYSQSYIDVINNHAPTLLKPEGLIFTLDGLELTAERFVRVRNGVYTLEEGSI